MAVKKSISTNYWGIILLPGLFRCASVQRRFIRICFVLFAVFSFASISESATTYDTSGSWNGGSVGMPFRLDNGFATRGQVITVPQVDTLLTHFSFWIYDYYSTWGPIPLSFGAYVAAWDGSKITGPILYSSGLRTTPVGQPSGFTKHTFDTGGIELTPGGSYVLFVSLSEFSSGGVNGSGGWATPFGVDAYPGGESVGMENETNFTALSTNAWIASPGSDLVFQASFVAGPGKPPLSIQPIMLQPRPLPQGPILTVSVEGSLPLIYQWRRNGIEVPGATNSALPLATLSSITSGNYDVVVTNLYGAVTTRVARLLPSYLRAWGNNTFGQGTVPIDFYNVVAISCGQLHNIALRENGTVFAWGNNNYNQLNVPANLTNVVAISAGGYFSLALRADGTVAAWGSNGDGQLGVPAGLNNVIGIAGGQFYSVALKKNGSVVKWGNGPSPPGLNNAVAIAAGWYHALALTTDGKVVGWATTAGWPASVVPAGLSNVVAIAAGDHHSLALKSDGTVIAWGDNSSGQTNVPAGLTNVLAIGAGGNHSLAVRNDGSLVTWGYNGSGQCNVPAGFGNAVAAEGGQNHTLALVSDGALPYFILMAPTNQGVLGGSSVVFRGTVVGGSLLSYQWKLNGTNLPNANGPALSLLEVQARHSGEYSVAISDRFGNQTNLSATLDVTPWLTVQWPALEALAEANVTFSASSSGYSPNSYQWIFNGTNLPGATNDSLVMTNVQFAQSGAYSVMVSNEFGFLISSNRTLSVKAWATVQPASVMAFCSSNVTLTASTGGLYPPGYQWQFNGQRIDSATNATLVLTNLQVEQTGNYSVVATGGSETAISSPSFVSVVPAAITSQPRNVNSILGRTVTLAVAANGPTSLTHQWRFNGSDISGATGITLTRTNATWQVAGTYNVVVCSDYGCVTSSVATVKLAQVVAWGNNSYGQGSPLFGMGNVATIASGGNHNLVLKNDGTVVAVGNTNTAPILTNAVAIAAGASHDLALRRDGTIAAWGLNSYHQTNVPANLSNVIAIAAGSYHSLALKRDGSIVAWGAGDNTLGPPYSYGQSIVPAVATNIVAISAGDTDSLALRSDGTAIAWGANFNGQTNVPVSATNIVSIAAGSYHNLALRADGTVVAWGLNNFGQTAIPSGLTNVIAITAGGYHSFALKADGTIVGWGNNNFGQSSNTFAISNIQAISAGFYHTAAIINDGSACFLRQPMPQFVTAGDMAAFRVVVAGEPNISCQWQFNGTNIDGATNMTLVLTNVPLDAAGIYQCVISNRFGSVQSGPGILTVLRSTPRFQSPGLQMSDNGFSLQLSGLSGHGSVVIYASTNLVDWTAVSTNPAVLGTFQFVDQGATNMPLQFYRAVEQ